MRDSGKFGIGLSITGDKGVWLPFPICTEYPPLFIHIRQRRDEKSSSPPIMAKLFRERVLQL
jgi:hypothetical protein